MQNASVEQAVVEEVASRVMRLDSAQRYAGAGCREVGHDPLMAPPLHRNVPIDPLRPSLLNDVVEEVLAVVAVSAVKQISAECTS